MALTLPNDFGNTPQRQLNIPENMTNLLLQICCAPCCGAVLECLRYHGVKPTLFFFNPNIHPKAEYEKRRDELIELAQLLDFPYIIPEYDAPAWFQAVKGLEHEPERGKRCDVCFIYRLKATALYAKEHGFSHFSSTLATSRWKNKQQVDQAGEAAALATGVSYWNVDWRKGGLVGRRYELVKSFAFYNQLYCGCVFSHESAKASLAAKEAREAQKRAAYQAAQAAASAPAAAATAAASAPAPAAAPVPAAAVSAIPAAAVAALAGGDKNTACHQGEPSFILAEPMIKAIMAPVALELSEECANVTTVYGLSAGQIKEASPKQE